MYTLCAERYVHGAESRRQRAKRKAQRPESADRKLKTANSKVAFRSHSSRHPYWGAHALRLALRAAARKQSRERRMVSAKYRSEKIAEEERHSGN